MPTAESGRKLRSHLVHALPADRRGFLSPRVQTPAQWLRHDLDESSLANRNDCLLAWTECLQSAGSQCLQFLFGFDSVKPKPDRSWALKTARLLQRLKSTLAEGNQDFQRVAKLEFEESERWQHLAILEKHYRQLLRGVGLMDPDDALMRAAAEGLAVKGSNRILLCGLPDPIPLLIHSLEINRLPAGVEVCIGAPSDQAAGFDKWGRPLSSYWPDQSIPLDRLRDKIHPSTDSAQSLSLLSDCLSKVSNPQKSFSVGLGEAELTSRIQDDLEAKGLTVHDPQGIPARQTDIPNMLNAWREWTRLDDFQSFVRLLAFPDIKEHYAARTKGFRQLLDEFSTSCLPATLSAVDQMDIDPKFEPLINCIRAMRRDRSKLGSGESFSEDLQQWLRSVWQNTEWDRRSDGLRTALLPEMRAWLKDWNRSAFRHDASADEALQMLVSHLQNARCYPPRPEWAIDINGWLELLWDDRHCICFVHLNEGLVPQSVQHDAFLPDSLRSRLGLPNNQQRFARDAYQFRFLIESRREEGRCDWIVGRFNHAGDPLKPSRLLFLCDRGFLPTRVHQVFSGLSAKIPEPPPSLAWLLDPRRIMPRSQERISPSDLRSYLSCPFRYYLQRILALEAWPESLTEMDAAAFGSLAHEALQAFNNSPQMLAISDEESIAKALQQELDRAFEHRFGRAASVALELQRISLHDRLRAAAGPIALARAEGWFPLKVEWKFHKELEPVSIGGLPLAGIIDLIEQQADTGQLRIIDYKTSDKPDRPFQAHLQKLGRNESAEDFRPYCLLDLDGSTYRWVNLQLPLYLWVTQHNLSKSTSVAYFNLPRASSECRLESWPDLDESLLQSALQCAEGIVADIQAGRFWPPGKGFANKALDAWLEPDIESVLHPDAIAMLKGEPKA